MNDKQTTAWRVIRQDSNGNHYIEAKNLSEIAATAFVATREKQIGDHHQSVWKQDQSIPAPYPELLVTLSVR